MWMETKTDILFQHVMIYRFFNLFLEINHWRLKNQKKIFFSSDSNRHLEHNWFPNKPIRRDFILTIFFIT